MVSLGDLVLKAKGAAEKLQPKPRLQKAHQLPNLVLLVPARLVSTPRLPPASEANATTGQIAIEIVIATGIVTGTATGTDVALTAAEAVAAAVAATAAVGNHYRRTTPLAEEEAETGADGDRRMTHPVIPLTRDRLAVTAIGADAVTESATRWQTSR